MLQDDDTNILTSQIYAEWSVFPDTAEYYRPLIINCVCTTFVSNCIYVPKV